MTKPYLRQVTKKERVDKSQSYNDMSLDIEKNDRARNNAPILPRTLDDLLHPRIGKGRKSLHKQADARPFLKYLIFVPLLSIFGMGFTAYVWIPLLEKKGMIAKVEEAFLGSLQEPLFQLIAALSLAAFFLSDIVSETWTFIMLKRGLRRVYQPESLPDLVHAVVVCQYKEPLEVLSATIESLALNTKARNTILCLASETRDTTAQTKFIALREQYGHFFLDFVTTYHTLEDDEIVGKSSNENFAVRELYEYCQERGLDPFQVMVTVCDADSLFDTVFLEQLEGEYRRMPDGSRVLYDSPINTYRNLPECCLLTHIMEVSRCQYTVFSGQSFRPAQSNYSLTLGFAHEINYWDPTNTSEDFHTTLKAMAMTGAGTAIVVRVWSLILNDSVAGFHDRWVQAKRHMWGIEEVAWVWTQFRVLRLNRWLVLVQQSMGQMLLQGSIVPAWLMLLFPPVFRVLLSLKPLTWKLIFGYYVVMEGYKWIKTCLREVLMYRCILAHRKHMMPLRAWHWIRLLALYPLSEFVATFVFNTLATWRMLVHALFHTTLHYVCAPKAFSGSIDNSSVEQNLQAPLLNSTPDLQDYDLMRLIGRSRLRGSFVSTASTDLESDSSDMSA